MRAFDRDLIRGGHYGLRPHVPRLKAEHMAAPTKAANVKKVLANSKPSTTKQLNAPQNSRLSGVIRYGMQVHREVFRFVVRPAARRFNVDERVIRVPIMRRVVGADFMPRASARPSISIAAFAISRTGCRIVVKL
jgi:hypothetical protein